MKINISYCGICGSDIPKFFMKRPRPDILGHEFCGRNENTAELVAVIPKVDDHTFIGSQLNGGFQKSIDVPERLILPIVKLDDPKYEILGTFIEPLANCIHCLNLINEDKYSKVAIIGNGFIGNLLKTLMPYAQMIDRHSEIEDNTFDVIIDCAGKPDSMNKCFKYLKPFGTLIMMGIPYSYEFNDNFNYDIAMRKELTIRNTWQSNFNSDWRMAYTILANNPSLYLSLISKVFPLTELTEAFNYKVRTHCAKVVVKCNG